MMIPLHLQDTVLLLTDIFMAALVRNERVLKILIKDTHVSDIIMVLARCSREGDVAAANLIWNSFDPIPFQYGDFFHFGYYVIGNALCGNQDMLVGTMDTLRAYFSKVRSPVEWAIKYAAWEGHIEIVTLLLDAFPGIAVNQRNLQEIATFALKVTYFPSSDKRIFPSIVDMLMLRYGLIINPLQFSNDGAFLIINPQDLQTEYGRTPNT